MRFYTGFEHWQCKKKKHVQLVGKRQPDTVTSLHTSHQPSSKPEHQSLIEHHVSQYQMDRLVTLLCFGSLRRRHGVNQQGSTPMESAVWLDRDAQLNFILSSDPGDMFPGRRCLSEAF
jgi:hypothetical protein